MNINSFLVKQLHRSHQEVREMILQGLIKINDKTALQKQSVTITETIRFNDAILQEGNPYFYFAYHKPVGVESTMNLNIDNNLVSASGITSDFFPIGRLDKASEGLMILTNDGTLYKKIIDAKNKVEKVYEVKVDKNIDAFFLQEMSVGVEIMGKKTQPCFIKMINENTFKITLTEGRNQQIRRMCYKLGYQVLQLKRIAIANLLLHNIAVGAYIAVKREEII
jgi:23S rRNA pseudouridine2604 synthase